MRRNILGMSQEKLGESLGITFQQIQKYEKGTNRVGASRLQAIASILDVPVAFFFAEVPGRELGRSTGCRTATSPDSSSISSTAARACSSTAPSRASPTPKVRRKVVDLVKALASEESD